MMSTKTNADGGSILLTGGTGFLGSHLLHRLLRDGRSVVLLKRSVSDTGRVKKALKSVIPYDIDVIPLERVFLENRVSVIVHCAADQGKQFVDAEHLLETNVLFPVRLLQLGRKYAVRAFVNTDTVLEGKVNAYALSKHHFRDWFKTYADYIACINVATELFYGPHDRESSFVSFVIHELLRNANTIDLTRGEQKRDFVYIEDVVEAFMRLIAHSVVLKSGYYEYQIGTSEARTIREIVTLMKTLTGNGKTRLNFGALPYREHEIMESRIDISGLAGLGWKPRYSLEDGLRATIDAERARIETS